MFSSLVLLSLSFVFILGQRGMIQEVTLNTKHGVEAKSYEAVSKLINKTSMHTFFMIIYM